ncbi:cation diffusion facilitator family transporter [Sunxiuqinia elliptica]|uniref:Cation diffusion facilitator family transporter n=1 Tax=Sunxiuqinia elliptica TaxID=655355 RepID=A0A4V6PRV2_9BACT|nr:cation diffusion facilitator family transporter [Sunxiuqinia elliptica]TDO03329.1 cation diffusion facilitator family transporter [Sunxiuqinia elliptica]TDO59526.1 cation diffusion facilitator family transporter [Sunxiuqinia elliptica]
MESNNKKYIILEGWISIFTNLFLFGLKYWAGLVSGSIALIADAWHTLTDSVSSVIVLLGGKLSSKPADEEHPFGHGRAEHIAAVIIGVLLAIVAFDFVLSAVEKFNSREGGSFGTIAIVVTIVSILGKEALAQYAFWGYRKTHSSVLKADGWHHRTDSLSSIVILVGILVGKYFWWIDSLLALIVALMIAYASYEILSKEIKSLLGERIDPELLEAIKQEVDQLFDRELYMHHFHLHRYGNHNELSCHIKLPPNMPLKEAHAICTRIENEIQIKFDLTTTIHPEPLEN